MKPTFMDEFQFRVNGCSSVDNYVETLLWGINTIQSIGPNHMGFLDPQAALVVDIFVHCPEAVEKCSKINSNVSTVFQKLFEPSLKVLTS